VGEEGEAAQHDPGPEQPGRDGKEQDLDQAALDEGELKGLEDRLSLMRMNLVCVFARHLPQHGRLFDHWESTHQSEIVSDPAPTELNQGGERMRIEQEANAIPACSIVKSG
jgi:hypothetical protein